MCNGYYARERWEADGMKVLFVCSIAFSIHKYFLRPQPRSYVFHIFINVNPVNKSISKL